MSRAKEQKKYQQAAALFQQEKYAQALVLLEHLDRSLPHKDRRVVYARARCLAELGRTDEALGLCKELSARFKDPRGQKLADLLRSNKDGAVEMRGARTKKGPQAKLQAPSEPALTRRFRWALARWLPTSSQRSGGGSPRRRGGFLRPATVVSISAIVGVLAATLFMLFNHSEIFARVDTVDVVDKSDRSVGSVGSVGSDKADGGAPLARATAGAEVASAATGSEQASAAAGSEANAAGEQPAPPVVRGGLNKVGKLHLRGIDPDVAWTEKHSPSSPLDEMPDSFAGLRISARAMEQKPLAISRKLDTFERAQDPLEVKYGFVPHARPMEEEFLRGGKDER